MDAACWSMLDGICWFNFNFRYPVLPSRLRLPSSSPYVFVVRVPPFLLRLLRSLPSPSGGRPSAPSLPPIREQRLLQFSSRRRSPLSELPKAVSGRVRLIYSPPPPSPKERDALSVPLFFLCLNDVFQWKVSSDFAALLFSSTLSDSMNYAAFCYVEWG